MLLSNMDKFFNNDEICEKFSGKKIEGVFFEHLPSVSRELKTGNGEVL